MRHWLILVLLLVGLAQAEDVSSVPGALLRSNQTGPGMFDPRPIYSSDSSSLVFQLKAPETANVFSDAGAATLWKQGYALQYQHAIIPGVTLSYVPEMRVSGISDSDPNLLKESDGDSIWSSQRVSLQLQPSSKWKVSGFLQDEDNKNIGSNSWSEKSGSGLETGYELTKLTHVQLALRQERESDFQNKMTDIDRRLYQLQMEQGLKIMPVKLRLASSWQEQNTISSGTTTPEYRPQMEEALVWEPKPQSQWTFGLRQGAYENGLSDERSESQTIFGAWKHALTPRLHLNMQANYEEVTRIGTWEDTGTPPQQNFNLSWGPQLQLSEALSAQLKMDYQFKQDSQRNEMSQQQITLSLKGMF